MLVAVLASGSEGNCTYIQTKDKKILIDLGMNNKYITTKLEELGVTPDEIDYLLITHTHSDHIGAMKQFFKKHSPFVFVDEAAMKELDFISDYENLCHDDGILEFGSMSIEPFRTSHDAPGARGYIIREEDKSCVYITDTGYIKDRLFKKLSNHTIYIFESNHDIELLMHGRYPSWLKRRVRGDEGHLSNNQAAFYLSKLIGPDTKKVILAHLSKENNSEELALATVIEGLKDNEVDFNDIEIAKQREKIECEV